MCRIDLCGQIGVKISSYGDRQFIKLNPLNCPMGQFIRREDSNRFLIIMTAGVSMLLKIRMDTPVKLYRFYHYFFGQN